MITEGLLLRHNRGAQFRDGALIDVAQDHALQLLHERGVFGRGLVFKGGTALRKFRLGNDGRFSTDLDFAVPHMDAADEIFAALHDRSLDGFNFSVAIDDESKPHATLNIGSHLGAPRIPARIDVTDNLPWLPADLIKAVPLPIHGSYSFTLPRTPIIKTEELLAEKLARYRRQALARDLYDLQWFTGKAFDESLVRRLTILKVWRDVNEDGLGTRPFDPEDVLKARSPRDFSEQAIGYLTKPVHIELWISRVRTRYAFLRDTNDHEKELLECNRRHGQSVRELIDGFRAGG